MNMIERHFSLNMKKIFYRIKLNLFSLLPKQLLKILFFCILFSMLLSIITIDRLNQYFINFISEKVDLTVNINSIVNSDDYSLPIKFIKDRNSTENYLEKSLYYINTVKSIAEYNDCDYYLSINCDFITSNNNKEKLINVSKDYFKQNPYETIESFDQFSCVAINQSLFDKLRQDNNNYDQQNICILQEGAEIATLKDDGSYETKPVKVGDKIKLNYIIGWTGTAYMSGDGEKLVSDIEYTVVGFTKDEANSLTSVDIMYIPLNSFLSIIQDIKTQFDENQSIYMFKPYQPMESHIYCTTLKQFTDVMNQLKISKDNGLYYNSNCSELAQLLSLTSAIGSNINDFLIIIIALTIITTIINGLLTIFTRRKEIGLLSSFGESKNNICLQIITEQIITIFISIPISLLMQKYISQKIIAYLSINNSLKTESIKTFFSQRILLQTSINDYLALLTLSILIIIIYGLIVFITISKNDPKELFKG